MFLAGQPLYPIMNFFSCTFGPGNLLQYILSAGNVFYLCSVCFFMSKVLCRSVILLKAHCLLDVWEPPSSPYHLLLSEWGLLCSQRLSAVIQQTDGLTLWGTPPCHHTSSVALKTTSWGVEQIVGSWLLRKSMLLVCCRPTFTVHSKISWNKPF